MDELATMLDQVVAEHLIADVADLVKHFAYLSGCDTVRVRLDVIDHNSCSKWHRDSVALRLITTYRGPGTQWVAAADSVDVLTRPVARGFTRPRAAL